MYGCYELPLTVEVIVGDGVVVVVEGDVLGRLVGAGVVVVMDAIVGAGVI